MPGSPDSGGSSRGTFINPEAKGALAGQHILPASINGFTDLAGEYEGIIKRVTLAPDVEGARN